MKEKKEGKKKKKGKRENEEVIFFGRPTFRHIQLAGITEHRVAHIDKIRVQLLELLCNLLHGTEKLHGADVTCKKENVKKMSGKNFKSEYESKTCQQKHEEVNNTI